MLAIVPLAYRRSVPALFFVMSYIFIYYYCICSCKPKISLSTLFKLNKRFANTIPFLVTLETKWTHSFFNLFVPITTREWNYLANLKFPEFYKLKFHTTHIHRLLSSTRIQPIIFYFFSYQGSN